MPPLTAITLPWMKLFSSASQVTTLAASSGMPGRRSALNVAELGGQHLRLVLGAVVRERRVHRAVRELALPTVPVPPNTNARFTSG
jgi:hypothetical protein